MTRDRRATTMRHARRPRWAGLRATFRFLIVSVAVVSVGLTSIVGIAVWQTASRIKPGIHLATQGDSPEEVPGVGAAEGEVNILLTGTDTRTGQGGEFSSADQLEGSSGVGSNDVTMVLHISKDHSSATVISIPRDLIAPVPACPTSDGGQRAATDAAQFNTTLARGGLPCVVLTAEKLTGLKIPFAAVISFDGVIALSNAIGGVTVCLASDINDTDSGLHLQAGERTIQGDTALQFVRTRHGVGDGGDLGRISNQQVFLSALMRKITTAGVLGNPVTLYSLANAAVANITPSDTLTNSVTLVSIALAVKNVSLANFVFLQYPTDADPDDPNRVVPDVTAVKSLNAALAADQPIQLSGGLGVAAEVATPAAPGDPASAPPTSTPDAAAPSSADPSGAAPAAEAPAAVLPTNVRGQTAAEETCSKKAD